MGSSHGYAYNFHVSSAHLRDIKSSMKTGGVGLGKVALIEIRTRFVLNGNTRGYQVLGSERFDIVGLSAEDPPDILASIYCLRLREYWMTHDEINTLSERAMAFLKGKMAEDPSLKRIPTVVDLDVLTVQQPDESYRAAKARAIVPAKLHPLYLFSGQSVVDKAIKMDLLLFLLDLPKCRVEEKPAAGMTGCGICLLAPRVADQITRLPECGCHFHNHCIVRHLEKKNTCPLCKKPQFDSAWLVYADKELYFSYYLCSCV